MSRVNQPPTPPRALPKGFGSVDAVLSAVAEGLCTVPAIARRTRLHRVSIHRLVKDLKSRGYLAFVGGVGLVPGPKLLSLGAVAARKLPLAQASKPVLERLAEATDERAEIFALAGDQYVGVAVAGTEPAADLDSGTRVTTGSPGRIFLAWMHEPVREQLLLSANNPERLRREVQYARRRGWAATSGEPDKGRGSISAPILGPNGEVSKAVCLSGPAFRLGRFSASLWAGLVKQAAADLSTGW